MKRHFKFLESVCFRIVPVLAMLIAAVSAHAGSIVNTKHNLSVSGPGTIKATTQTDICIFCHTPHRAISDSDGPLWNHNASAANYTVYSSPSMDATVEQPNGASKLCLSCHDGTVALGSVHSRSAPIDMQGGVTTMPAGPSNVGTDLSQDHPISFTYDAGLAAQDGNLVDPSTLTGKVRLDGNSRMQCTACHNPHDDQYGNFLVMDASGSALCNTCHTPPMGGSTHATSTASLESLGTSAVVQRKALASSKGSGQKRTAKQPKTVGANGCANCHGSHGSGARKELLLTKREEQTCFTCHNGSVVQENLVPEFSKPSVHPVLETSHLHSSGEDSVNNARHVACSDCHNTHASKRMGKSGNGISGALLNVNGVSRTGAAVEEAKQEYELCFRCHADTAGQDKPTVPRFTQTTNTRMEFNPSNRSYHPVCRKPL